MANINLKKQIARKLVGGKYPIDNPDLNIRATLDEPVEQIAAADYYNWPAAKWVALSTPFVWVPLDHEELDKVQIIRDLGKICFAHLADKPKAAVRDVFGG